MAEPATIVLLRFDEESTDVPPSDAAGSLIDMSDDGSVATTIVPGFTGTCRRFAPTDIANGAFLQTSDAAPGTSLVTRDVTIDAIVRWDFDGQVAFNDANAVTMAVVCTRGTFANGAGPLEEVSAYSMCLRVVSADDRIGELVLAWHREFGDDVVPFGGQFEMPAAVDNGFMLLTVTRHWKSLSEVQVQCYVNDVLVGDAIVTDGDIGGTTLGTFNVGGVQGLFSAYPTGFFVGDVDELRVRNYHVTAEEVTATWKRIAEWQPFGYSMVRQLLPPRAPISDDPASRIQRLLKLIGHGFGFTMGQTDNFRQNTLPDQAYGSVLERWESITRESPRSSDTTDMRRRRVVGHMRQRQGVSPPGVAAAVADLLALAPTQVEIVALSQDVVETFATGINSSRWWVPQSGVTWTGAGDQALRIVAFAGDTLNPRSIADSPARTALIAVQADGDGAHFIATMIENAVMPDQGEAGMLFADWQRNATLYFGVRNVSGVRAIVAELNVNGVVEAAAVLATAAAVPTAPLVLHMYQVASVSPTSATFRFEWSTGPWGTNTINGLTLTWDTTTPTIKHPLYRFDWAGFYARTLPGGGPLAAGLDVKFTDCTLRTNGERPFLWYVFRDPSIPGEPDIIGAQRAAQRIAQAHTKVGIVTTLQAVCDDIASQSDNTPTGGI